MSMFPGPGAEIIRNEEGEVLGWDYPSQDDSYDPRDDFGPEPDRCEEHDQIDCGEHHHEWGELEHSRFAGTLHRKCLDPDCRHIKALEDEEDGDES